MSSPVEEQKIPSFLEGIVEVFPGLVTQRLEDLYSDYDNPLDYLRIID